MEKSVHEFGSVGTVIDSSVGISECMCVLRWECGEKLLNRCYQGCNTKRQRAINNAMTCLISVLDCLAPFTAAYRVCVCVCGLYSEWGCSVVAFVVNVWCKYSLSLKITHADAVERKALLCENEGQEEESVWIRQGHTAPKNTPMFWYGALWKYPLGAVVSARA